MDLTGSLYDIFGVSEPLYLGIGALVALLLAGYLSAAVLEAARIYREYVAEEPPGAPPEAKPALLPEKGVKAGERVDLTRLGEVAAQAAEKPPQLGPRIQPREPVSPSGPARPPAPPVEVLKDTLAESMEAISSKYGLEWLTIASGDGLVIASTSSTPDEDAAVYSSRFFELHKARPEPYFAVVDTDVHLLLVESGAHRLVDVARKPGPMAPDEAAGLREDSRRIVERFAWGEPAKAPK